MNSINNGNISKLEKVANTAVISVAVSKEQQIEVQKKPTQSLSNADFYLFREYCEQDQLDISFSTYTPEFH